MTTAIVTTDSVQDFHDANVTVRKLADALQTARYSNSRSGLIPPQDLQHIVATIQDALDTLRLFVRAQT